MDIDRQLVHFGLLDAVGFEAAGETPPRGSDFIALGFLESRGEAFSRRARARLGIGKRGEKIAPALDQRAGIAAVAEGDLGRRARDRLLVRLLGLEPPQILAQLFRELVESRQLAALLVDLPAMQTNEAVERGHGLAVRIASSAA